jgi:2-desacetyl-2-hydroxyethyl bacteriochlorophyllide A dehydrogenase
MKAVTIEAPGRLSVADVDARRPEPGEVRIDVSLVGICATDVHILHGTFPTAAYPIVPGHEVAGRVVELGDGVDALAVGDEVVVDPGLPCLVCRQCRRGRLNLCENRNAIGITRQGGAAESLTLPAANCHRVLPGTPDGAAVLAEPLACVVHAFDLIRPPAGLDVLVYGAGTIGVLAGVVARSLGAASLSYVELDEDRAGRTARLGAEAAASADLLSRTAWDLVVDATGAAPAIADALTRIDRGGTLLQIGVARPDAMVELSPYQVFQRELTIAGSLTTRYSFPRALALLATGAVDHTLVTGEPFPLSEYAEAIAAAGTGRPLKVTVDPRG